MRLLIHVEGLTEETFVSEAVGPYLIGHGFTQVSARIIGNPRERSRRGGIKPWSVVKQGVVRHLQQDTGCIATTMVDYYGLPAAGEKAWPGRADAVAVPHEQKAAFVEQALVADIASDLTHHQQSRFVPFVVMHEFEALLFSDCTAFADAMGTPHLANTLHQIRAAFGTPEEINDSPVTAPSKRLLSIVPNYEKPLHGNVAALGVGINCMKDECPHFSGWIDRLINILP